MGTTELLNPVGEVQGVGTPLEGCGWLDELVAADEAAVERIVMISV